MNRNFIHMQHFYTKDKVICDFALHPSSTFSSLPIFLIRREAQWGQRWSSAPHSPSLAKRLSSLLLAYQLFYTKNSWTKKITISNEESQEAHGECEIIANDFQRVTWLPICRGRQPFNPILDLFWWNFHPKILVLATSFRFTNNGGLNYL